MDDIRLCVGAGWPIALLHAIKLQLKRYKVGGLRLLIMVQSSLLNLLSMVGGILPGPDIQAKRETAKALASRGDVAATLGVSEKLLRWMLYGQGASRYHTFNLTTRRGKVRVVHAPNPYLRAVQSRLDEFLRGLYEPTLCAHGYIEKRGALSNAMQHIGQRWVLNIDLESFFPTITFARVRGLLMAEPYGLQPAVATVIAQIACRNGELPIGAPSSPVLSNMICRRMDWELFQFARKRNCRYTRYADDISFSSWRSVLPVDMVAASEDGGPILRAGLTDIIADNGFQINNSKTRLRRWTESQRVTGIVVNRKANVPRGFFRRTTAMLHAWEKFGVTSAEEEYNRGFRHASTPQHAMKCPSFSRVVQGHVEYIGQVCGRDSHRYSVLKAKLDKLLGKVGEEIEFHHHVANALWVLETSEDCDDVSRMSQGTAFALRGVGFVTCAHVLTDVMVAFQADNPGVRASVVVLHRDDDRDLALLSLEGVSDSATGLEIDYDAPLEFGKRVFICGYPNYGHGRSATIIQTTVSGTRARMLRGVELRDLAGAVVHGGSGGPIVDESGFVVGVAKLGSANILDAQRDNNAMIHAKELRAVIEEYAKRSK